MRVPCCRHVGKEPTVCKFHAGEDQRETITLKVEELEALRLCDKEGMDQGEAALQMRISRGTFQRILYAARYKSAYALSEGCSIEIGGGNYCLHQNSCEKQPCEKKKQHCKRGNES